MAGTKARMREQHYSEDAIAAHKFEVELPEQCDASEIEEAVQHSFVFYEEE